VTYPQQYPQYPAQQYPQQRQAPAVPAAPAPSANDALMGGGGPRHPGVQFAQPGDGVRNAVVLAFESRQERAFVPPRADGTTVPWHERAPLTFPSGDPIYGVVITVQTTDRLGPEDDGKRSLFVEGKGKKQTLRDAIRAAGASGLEVGAVIDFVFTHSENPNDPKARKHYSARYVPAAQAGANAALGVAPQAQQAPEYGAQYQPTPAPASPWAPGAYPQQAAPVAPGAVPPWVTQ